MYFRVILWYYDAQRHVHVQCTSRDNSSGGTTLFCSQQRCACSNQIQHALRRLDLQLVESTCNCRSCCDQTNRQGQAHGLQIEVLQSPIRSAQTNLTVVRRDVRELQTAGKPNQITFETQSRSTALAFIQGSLTILVRCFCTILRHKPARWIVHPARLL